MRAHIARALRVVSEHLRAKAVTGLVPGAANAVFEPLESRQLLSTYYVNSSSGSDSASGTATTSAWRSINRVNSQTLHSGDKVLFQGGQTFSGGLYIPSSEGGVTFGTYGSGKATISSGSKAGIDIAQTAGITISNLNFRGATSSAAGIYLHINFSNKDVYGLNVSNCDVSGYGRGLQIMIDGGGSSLSNVTIKYSSFHDNKLDGVKITGSAAQANKNYTLDHVNTWNNTGSSSVGGVTGSGIFIADVDGCKITRCVSHDNGVYGAAPVGIWASASNRVTIEYSESYNNKTRTTTDGGGFDFDWDVHNSTIQYCYTHNNAGPGYILAAGTHTVTGCTYRYNVSENDGRKNGRAGMQVWGDVRDSSFYNNVVYITATGNSNTAAIYIHDLGASGRTPQNFTVRNNVFYTTGGTKIVNITSGVASNGHLSFNGNCYYTTGGTFKIQWGSSTYSSLSSWQSAKGQEKMSGINTGYQGDPKFISVGHGGTIGNADNLRSMTAYKLQTYSPLINRGVSQPGVLSSAIVDFYGDLLPRGGKYDIGIDEVA